MQYFANDLNEVHQNHGLETSLRSKSFNNKYQFFPTFLYLFKTQIF